MNGTLHQEKGHWYLRFERRLAHAPEKVWRALTDENELSRWFPANIEGERAVGAALRFVFREDEGPTLSGTITEFDPPRLLAYTWDNETLRWELHPTPEGCLLVFTAGFREGAEAPEVDDRSKAARDGAGWHACLEIMEVWLSGQWIRWDGRERAAKLHPGYVERFS